jgi:isopropylmalate/homocitrate/citramalate synthase
VQPLELELGEALPRERLEGWLEEHPPSITQCDSHAVTLDRSLVWTGDLNARALEPQPRVTVGLYDTTLRDGEQTVGVVLDPEQKVEIAKALSAAGVDRIEAGFPRVSEDDARAISLILDAGLDAEIWGFSRAVRADVEALVELGLRASVIESPISDGKLAALGVSQATMLERIRAAVSFAVQEGIRVAFFGVDSSRADIEFVRHAYESAVEAGAQEVVVVDTLGIATPEAAAYLVAEVVERLDGEVPVHWHGHDDFGLATAAAVAAVQAGATWVQGTVNGMGERAGNADLVEVALALEALYGIPTRLRLEQARALGSVVQQLSGTQLAPWKAVTGDNLFTRESGAVAAQFHDPQAIEPYSSELVGATRGIVLGKKSGLDSIRIKVAELGLDVPEERFPVILDAVKRAGTKKRGLVTDGEFKRIARRVTAS